MESLQEFDLYEGELELLTTKDDLIYFLTELHREVNLTDLSGLLDYYIEIENYEYCQAVKDFSVLHNINYE